MTSGQWDSAPDQDVSGESVSSDDVSSDDVLVVDEVVAPEVTPSPDAVLPVWESTGNADVDGALESLHALADTDVTQHVGVFEEVESALRATLNGLVAEDELDDLLLSTLRGVFGLRSFKPGQRDAIRRVMLGTRTHAQAVWTKVRCFRSRF